MTPSTPCRRYFTLDAGLGDERVWMGNVVRPILVEQVTQVWTNGVMSECRTVKESGRLALVLA